MSIPQYYNAPGSRAADSSSVISESWDDFGIDHVSEVDFDALSAVSHDAQSPISDSNNWENFRDSVIGALQSRIVGVIMGTATVIALFGYDVRLLFFQKDSDPVWTVIISTCFFLFLIEVILNSIVKTTVEPGDQRTNWRQHLMCGLHGYLFSFFFWLDFVATMSLIPEIEWIWGPIIGDDSATSTNLTTARAGRISRAGSKASRILRMVRIVRLVKFYTIWRRKGQGEVAALRESKVGSKVSDYMTRRVIFIVLLMLLCVPIFQYNDEDFGEEYATDYVHSFNKQRDYGWEATLRQTTAFYGEWADQVFGEGDPRIVRTILKPETGVPADLLIDLPDVYNDLRVGLAGDELRKVREKTTVNATEYVTEIWFNRKPITQVRSLYNILLTIFVTFLLGVWAMQFTFIAQKLVLRPIEQVIAYVDMISKNPAGFTASSRSVSKLYETKVLENSVKKMGEVLKVSFGPYGASVVSRSLDYQRDSKLTASEAATIGRMRGHSATGEARWSDEVVSPSHHGQDHSQPAQPEQQRGFFGMLNFQPRGSGGSNAVATSEVARSEGHFNPIMIGKVVRCVFVSFRVEDFEWMASELQADVAIVLNRLAKIVHDSCMSWGGFPSKNSSDRFLMVWRLPDDDEHALRAENLAHRKQSTFHDNLDGLDEDISRMPSAADPSTRSGHEGTRRGHSQDREGDRGQCLGVPCGSILLGSRRFELPLVTSPQTSSRALGAAADTDTDSPSSFRGGASVATATHSPSTDTSNHPSSTRQLSTMRGDASSTEHDVGGVTLTPTESDTVVVSTDQPAPTPMAQTPPQHQSSQRTPSSYSAAAKRRAYAQSGQVIAGTRHGGSVGQAAADANRKRDWKFTVARRKLKELANQALLAAVHSLAEVYRSKDLAFSPEIAKLRAARPGFLPSLRCGIHMGWAVEAAVGSLHKLDAIYASPHVDLTHRLNLMASAHNVSIVLSGSMKRLLAPAVRSTIRKIGFLERDEAFHTTADSLHPSRAQASRSQSRSASCAGVSPGLEASGSSQHDPDQHQLPIYVFDTWEWRQVIPASLVRAACDFAGQRLRNSNARTFNAIRAGRPAPAVVSERSLSASAGGDDSYTDDSDDMEDVLIKQPPGLLTFEQTIRKCPSLDAFNKRSTKLSEAERRISLLGEADFIEHPIIHRDYDNSLWATDPDVCSMQAPFHRAFRDAFDDGYLAYQHDEHAEAAMCLLEALRYMKLTPPAAHVLHTFEQQLGSTCREVLVAAELLCKKRRRGYRARVPPSGTPLWSVFGFDGPTFVLLASTVQRHNQDARPMPSATHRDDA